MTVIYVEIYCKNNNSWFHFVVSLTGIPIVITPPCNPIMLCEKPKGDIIYYTNF